MKKIATIVFAVLSAGYVAQAGAISLNGADPSLQVTIDQAGANACAMVSATSSFLFTPSKNVGVKYLCDATAIAVNAGNLKGKYTYGGSSNGGSVHQCSTAAAGDIGANGFNAGFPTAATTDGCS